MFNRKKGILHLKSGRKKQIIMQTIDDLILKNISKIARPVNPLVSM